MDTYAAAATATVTATEPQVETTTTEHTEKPERRFADVMKTRSNDQAASLERTVGRFVDRVADDERRVEGAMRRMMSGRELDSVDLLRTQALIYGHAQRVELASKCVEKATSGLKQMMNTQV